MKKFLKLLMDFVKGLFKQHVKQEFKLGLSAPWTIYYRQVQALFNEDEDINVVFDERDFAIKLYVENQEKADVLADLLPNKQVFGNVVLAIKVIPANEELNEVNAIDDIQKFKILFEGNDAVSYTEQIQVQTNPMFFIVFKKEVVQFFTDNLSDIHGLCSTLYQNLAEEIFEHHDGVYFCTDNE